MIVETDNGEERRNNIINFNEVDGLELSYIESVKNVQREHNLSINEIITIASANPAKYIGVNDKMGSLETGKYADLLTVEDDFTIKDIYVQVVNHKVR